ncbi:hypothetical protein C0Q70_12019 [Pomacea canaliculata]|uniref:Ig-like domain-containing protein n=2 Tax=Pomacea canaliculata TaxID=400727 RepID=A0A2T7P0D2_POMCA|nr:hypothetical protein C0Q70_12019 [Pomacea canaliculata]
MSLSLCAGNVVLECDETRNFNTFTCTGFTAQQTVLSKLVYDNQIIALGSCQPLTGGTSTCIPGALSKAFHLSRTSATASSISALSGTTLSTFSEKGSLTCTSQEGNDETTCLLDYIYRASGSMCEVYFSTVSTWSVVVNCSINKTRSRRRRYSCQLRQHDQMSGTTVLLPAVQLSVTQTSPDGYVSGVCNITSFLPSEGRYTYEVFITPGNVNVSANFIGSNIIRRPAGSLTHNCPQYVTGADLNCQCAVSDLGSPPGTMQWNNTVSSQLSLKGLRTEQHGENYVCSLTWNRTVQQSLTYTLIMTYPTTCDDLISAEFSRGQRSGLGIGLRGCFS